MKSCSLCKHKENCTNTTGIIFGGCSSSFEAISPAEAWRVWKDQLLTMGEMVEYQTITGIYFNEKGEILK